MTENVKHTLHWDNSLYAANCFLAKDHNEKIVVVADFNTVVLTDPVHDPFSLPIELNDDEDFDEDEDYDK